MLSGRAAPACRRLTLRQAWIPGVNAPLTEFNTAAFASDMDTYLRNINDTLNALTAKTEAAAALQEGLPPQPQPDTMAARRAVNARSAPGSLDLRAPARPHARCRGGGGCCSLICGRDDGPGWLTACGSC
jgi:hypothetical protein